MNFIAFVVTCQRSLDLLHHSIPQLLKQADAEFFLIDHEPEHRVTAVVSKHFPKVRIVSANTQTALHISRGRNAAAKASSAQWLCFLNSEVIVTDDFVSSIRNMLQEGYFYHAPISTSGISSVHLCLSSDYMRIEGYDELIEHSDDGEDDDLFYRLGCIGRRGIPLPAVLFNTLRLDGTTQTPNQLNRSKTPSLISTLYRQLKYDITSMSRTLNLSQEVRQELLWKVKRSQAGIEFQGSGIVHLEVGLNGNLAVSSVQGCSIKRRINYDITLQPGVNPAIMNFYGKALHAYFQENPSPKLHIGCGRHLLEGWLNADLVPMAPSVLPLDATQPLPMADASFEFIFSEHVIEHMPYPQGCALLGECWRVLKPGGTLRIATPDLAFLIGLYAGEKSAPQQAFMNWSKEAFIPWAPVAEDTFIINNAVRDWGHQFIYDEKVLLRAFTEAGFSSINRCKLMESNHPELSGLENITRTPEGMLALETMVFEATKN